MKLLKYSSTKWLVLSVIIFFLMMIVVCLVGQSTMRGMTDGLSAMTQWTQQHHELIILWHMLIIAAIYVLWGHKIKALKNKGHINEKQSKKILKYRYAMMAFIVIVDLTVYWF
jgi:hypothetical protein